MLELAIDRLNDYRAGAFRTGPGLRVRTRDEAIAYANERGFLYFWPIKDIAFPSLWTAVAGDRPVADEHDDPGHVTWGWKDELLGARVWHYAKVLRRRATIISLELLPYFYALSENYGAPAEDYLIQYEEGRLTNEAKSVYEALLNEGPLDTIALRSAARLSSSSSNSPYARAMDQLQADFKVLPIGVAPVGAWRYAFVYDLVTRHYPDLAEAARPISTNAARRELARRFFLSLGAATRRDLRMLFGWRPADIDRAVSALIDAGFITKQVVVEGSRDEWFALPELFDGDPEARKGDLT